MDSGVVSCVDCHWLGKSKIEDTKMGAEQSLDARGAAATHKLVVLADLQAQFRQVATQRSYAEVDAMLRTFPVCTNFTTAPPRLYHCAYLVDCHAVSPGKKYASQFPLAAYLTGAPPWQLNAPDASPADKDKRPQLGLTREQYQFFFG